MSAIEGLLATIGAKGRSVMNEAMNLPNPGRVVASGVDRITDPSYPVDAALRQWVSKVPAFQPTLGGMLQKTGTKLLDTGTEFVTALQNGDYESAINSPIFPMGGMTVYRGSPVKLAGMADDYKISHRPMRDAGGAARLDDLTKAFPEDVYGKDALQYYGSGDPREANVMKALKRLRGKPDADVTIYRGIPKGASGAINPGDWVTLDESVARDYGEQVVSKKVKASDVTSWADSLLEFGYWPK